MHAGYRCSVSPAGIRQSQAEPGSATASVALGLGERVSEEGRFKWNALHTPTLRHTGMQMLGEAAAGCRLDGALRFPGGPREALSSAGRRASGKWWAVASVVRVVVMSWEVWGSWPRAPGAPTNILRYEHYIIFYSMTVTILPIPVILQHDPPTTN